MIDLHCHILPGVDDGARDLDDAAEMARIGAEDGIQAVCATPHIRHDHDVRIHEVAGRVEALNARLRADGTPLVVLKGGEVAETAVEDLSEEELSRVALGSGSWILLEPAPGPLSDNLRWAVEHLAAHGHRSLIAHPERHLSADMFERMADLVDDGALVQATADFFLREEMAAGMLALAEAGLIHVLSSDSHTSLGGRQLQLSAAFERLGAVERIAPHLEWMAETAPQTIVEGGRLSIPFDPQLPAG